MTKEELQETYSKLSTSELMEIVDRKFSYTEIAVIVAMEELSKRNVTETDIQAYKKEIVDKIGQEIKKNVDDDLTLFQKNFFFFIFIPIINFALKRNFEDDGFILKLNQAKYYSLLGFIFLIVSALISFVFDFSDIIIFAFWILSFLVAYTFDEFFNRHRLIKKLKRQFRIGDSSND